jgi:uncharacterized protein YjbI with pentapeptide repeats
MGRKKPSQKAESPSKRRIAWPRWTGFSGMTVRDWLPIVGALLIPVVIALGTWWITWQQAKIEDQRAQAERELEAQRAQDAALQAYLDQMTQLMLDRNLREADQDSEVRTMARVRTLTMLSTLDPTRKEEVLRFLYEASLLDRSSPVVELSGADLRSIDLYATNLSGGRFAVDTRAVAQQGVIAWAKDAGDYDVSIDLSGADLSHADLRRSVLAAADLHSVNLHGADLRLAWLAPSPASLGPLASLDDAAQYAEVGPFMARLPKEEVSDLQGANLYDADLRETYLAGAVLDGANLTEADLTHAWMPGVSLARADLSKAVLNTNLRSADLSDADLSGANLLGADLRDADLSGANLTGATGYTNEGLDQWTSSLEGATMLDGQKYEDWLKSKGRGEDGENT